MAGCGLVTERLEVAVTEMSGQLDQDSESPSYDDRGYRRAERRRAEAKPRLPAGSIPLHRALKTFSQRHVGLEAEQTTGFGRIGLRIMHVTLTGRPEHRVE